MSDESSQQMETGGEVELELASSGKAWGMAPLIRHAQPKGSVAESELSNLLRGFWQESHPSQHLVDENTGKPASVGCGWSDDGQHEWASYFIEVRSSWGGRTGHSLILASVAEGEENQGKASWACRSMCGYQRTTILRVCVCMCSLFPPRWIPVSGLSSSGLHQRVANTFIQWCLWFQIFPFSSTITFAALGMNELRPLCILDKHPTSELQTQPKETLY